ncbi:LytR/AlgR family response regulator transcription factor [Pseudoduganella sp. HUAS MS19]
MKAVVVEDSRLAREGLVRMLQAFPEIDVIGQADHPGTALALMQELRPEVVFLDIHMPGATGFDLLEQLDYVPRVIFTTAYSEHAIRSFDFHTVDYLLKPISMERLAVAIGKLTGDPGAVEADEAQKPELEFNSKVFIKDGDRCHLVSLDSIHYIESCKNYVQVFFGDKRAYVKKSLNSLEARLPRKFFFRANRQHIVNLQSIVRIEESMNLGYDVTLTGGKVLEISRRNAAELKELLSF